jgi:hypothetical protein
MPGAYSALMEEGPGGPGGMNMGGQAMPVGNREGADSFRQRALGLHQQLIELEKQYGSAAIIPRNVVSQIQQLHSAREHAINQWQELTSRADTETDATLRGQSAFGENSSVSALLAPDKPVGQHNKDVSERLADRAAGQVSPPQPRGRRAGPGGTTPQFGSVARQ